MPFILQTSGLSKKIGSKALVTDVNMGVRTIFGPNVERC